MIYTPKQVLISPTPKILVVDDEDDWRQMMCDLLRPEFVVLVASCGDEALACIQRELPDLVIIDRNMRPMSGDELLSSIRELDTAGWMRIVMFSVRSDIGEQCTALKKADAYITKACDMKLVIHQLRNLLQQQRADIFGVLSAAARNAHGTFSPEATVLLRGLLAFFVSMSGPLPCEEVDMRFIFQQMTAYFAEKMGCVGTALQVRGSALKPHLVIADEVLLLTAVHQTLKSLLSMFMCPSTIITGLHQDHEHVWMTVEVPVVMSSHKIEQAVWWMVGADDNRNTGLPLARLIIHRLGGTFTLLSRGQGILITIKLPAVK